MDNPGDLSNTLPNFIGPEGFPEPDPLNHKGVDLTTPEEHEMVHGLETHYETDLGNGFDGTSFGRRGHGLAGGGGGPGGNGAGGGGSYDTNRESIAKVTYIDATTSRKKIIKTSLLNQNDNDVYDKLKNVFAGGNKNTRLQARKVDAGARSTAVFGNKISMFDADRSKEQQFAEAENSSADWRYGESTLPPGTVSFSTAGTIKTETTTSTPTTRLPDSE